MCLYHICYPYLKGAQTKSYRLKSYHNINIYVSTMHVKKENTVSTPRSALSCPSLKLTPLYPSQGNYCLDITLIQICELCYEYISNYIMHLYEYIINII